MTKGIFDSLMIHTCSVVQAATATDELGQQTTDWTISPTTTTLIPCRLQPQTERELVTGAVISDHLLWMDRAKAPTSLRSNVVPDTHRITTVAWRGTGSSLDAGPFDVREVQDQAGEGHHLQLKLMRIG